MTSFILGCFVGLLLALTGAGGGMVSVPLLVFVLKIPVAKASPIALLAVMMASSLGSSLGLRAGLVRYKAAILLALCGMVLSPFGLWLAQRVPDRWLGGFFSLVLLSFAIHMFKQSNFSQDGLELENLRTSAPCKLDQDIGKLSWTAPCARSIMLSGSLAGFLSGLIGVGGGFVVVPAMKRFTDLDFKTIVCTSLAAIALVSAGSVAMATISGLMDWEKAWPFALGAAAGMLLGGSVSRFLHDLVIQRVFAVFAMLVACVMLFNNLM